MIESFEPEEIKLTSSETIGEEPDRETYDVYEGSSKMMELAYFENSKEFWIYVQKLPDSMKVPGETTKLFQIIIEKVQNKANDLNEPVILILDSIKDVIKNWAKTKAAEVLNGWDSIDPSKGIFKKTFHPQN